MKQCFVLSAQNLLSALSLDDGLSFHEQMNDILQVSYMYIRHLKTQTLDPQSFK